MRAFAAILFVLLAGAAPAQKNTQPATTPARKSAQKRRGKAQDSLVFWNMSRGYVDLFLDHVPQANTERLAEVRRIFMDLECRGSHLREQEASGKNLICTLPGTARPPDPSSGTIVFLAHYEHEGAGQSAVDNWSGAIMLPFLYHALSATPRQHTFIFAEVDAAAGARAFFDSLSPEDRRSIKGVIALDALGLGPVKMFISPIDEERYAAWGWLYPVLLQAAIDQRVSPPGFLDPDLWIKVDDTREFRHHNIPSMLIHSVAWNMPGVPGSARDKAAINGDKYFQTITLLDDFAAELDRPPPSEIERSAPTPSARRRR